MAEENSNVEGLFDLPAGMFQSGDKEPEDFPILVWRTEQRDGETKLVGDSHRIEQRDYMELQDGRGQQLVFVRSHGRPEDLR